VTYFTQPAIAALPFSPKSQLNSLNTSKSHQTFTVNSSMS